MRVSRPHVHRLDAQLRADLISVRRVALSDAADVREISRSGRLHHGTDRDLLHRQVRRRSGGHGALAQRGTGHDWRHDWT
jgi:hypothetical protein